MKNYLEDGSATWLERYNKMRERHGWTNKDIAHITGLSESTIRSSVIRLANETKGGERRFPPWLRLAIVIDEINADCQSY